MMENLIRKNDYHLINFCRFLCSLLIVAIHTVSREEDLGYFIIITARIAVPFFFICSGYFLSDKLYYDNPDIRKQRIYNYIKNIFSIYLKWSLVYLVVRFISYFIDNINLIKGLVLCVRDFLFVGIKGHLWYLSALIFSVYLLYLLIGKYKIKYKYICLLSLVLYLFSLSADAYNGLFINTMLGKIIDVYVYLFGEVWNSYAQGLIFIVMGIGIKKYDFTNKIHRPVIVVIISYGLFIIEHCLLKYMDIPRDNNTSLFLLILSPFIFISLLKFETSCKIKHITKYSSFYKNSSLTIYLIHPLIMTIVNQFFNLMQINELQYISYLKLIFVFLISLFIAILEQKYKELKVKENISYVKKYKLIS